MSAFGTVSNGTPWAPAWARRTEISPAWRCIATTSSLAVFGGEIYAGGAFLTAGNVSARRVARWDGVQWQPLGDGVNDALTAFTIHGTELVAVGGFTQADGVIVNGVGRWNRESWSAF